ncbi:MAG: pitrilysin family protein [Byssovorax sp.]
MAHLARSWALAALGAAALGAAPAHAAEGALSIPFTRTTLDNGLTVILHEDHSLPLVAVNIMVTVGSRFEEPKRTGFAHLFEHLMFMGTKRAPTKMFDAWMEAEGGWNNATTSEDRTDYFEVGPSHSLPLLLWLEGDRFSALGKEMTLEKLDAQREVVRNERRQTSENEPYGKVELRLPELMYPEGHPYHHPVIGSHEDLQAATVDDVKAFFSRYYVPNNASLVIAGDFQPDKVRDLVETTFGWLPRSDVPKAPAGQMPKLTSVVRETIADNVELPKVVMAWHTPARFAPGDAELDLLSTILKEGKSSRLYKALVYDRPLAQEVDASQSSQDLSSVFTVEAIAQPGVSLDKLEAAMDEEIDKLRKEPVSAEELKRAKNQFETAFVSKIQAIGERAMVLNRYQTHVGDPGYIEKDLQRYRSATAESISAMVKTMLDPNARVILRVVPKDEAKDAPAGKKGGGK